MAWEGTADEEVRHVAWHPSGDDDPCWARTKHALVSGGVGRGGAGLFDTVCLKFGVIPKDSPLSQPTARGPDSPALTPGHAPAMEASPVHITIPHLPKFPGTQDRRQQCPLCVGPEQAGPACSGYFGPLPWGIRVS